MLNYNSIPLNRTRSTEWLLACLLLAWGWQMVRPENFFDAPVYVVMRSVALESTWGMAAVLAAGVRLVALYINGWWRRTPIIRCAGAIIGGMFWLVIYTMMYFGAQAAGAKLPPGIIYYVVFFGFEGWCVVSTGYDMAKEGSFGTRPPSEYVSRRA